jgi:site-specific DNA-cytosine methylase
MEEFFKAKAKEKQKLSEGKGIQKSEDLKRPEIVATKELGKIANVSHDTIAKVKAIQEKAPEQIKEKLQTGEVSINQAYLQIKTIENKDLINIDKLNKYIKIEEIKNLKIVQYDSNMFYESSDYLENRFGDKIMSLSDEKYYTVTTLERFFHRETGIEFSLREYANVQMFPSDFKFIGNYNSIKKQIGNAVSPYMGKYISKQLTGKTCGDIFSGCGGFTCGLHKNGITSKWAIEWEHIACQSYKLNFPDTKVICANITKVNPLELEKVDIIVGGPPCQGFSNAGSENRSSLQRFIEDPRNSLYKEFVRFVNNLKPKEFIMENVKEIEQFKDEIIKDFELVGYNVSTLLIEGNKIGMKQNRKRFFFIGKLKD